MYVVQICLSISGVQWTCFCLDTRALFGGVFFLSSDSSVLALAFLIDGKVNGSGASLSGLVQLPPNDGEYTELPFESSEESDMIEQVDIGRLIDSPMCCCLKSIQLLPGTVSCADGVLGAVIYLRG